MWEQVSVMFLFFFFFPSVSYLLALLYSEGCVANFLLVTLLLLFPLWPFAIEIILIADVIMTSKNCIE